MRHHAIDILLHRGLGQAEAWNSPVHHAAEPAGGFVDVHLVTGLGDIVRRGQTGRPGADDGDGFILRDFDRR